jgi:hypothetical protein
MREISILPSLGAFYLILVLIFSILAILLL